MAKTAAELLKKRKFTITPPMINYYCADGRIPGAVKAATVWLIPKDAEKPIDGRRKAAH